MKINYVIATWSGKNTKRNENYHKWVNPSPSEVLKIHLQQLNKFTHHLTQITIMKPYCDPEKQCMDYYNIEQEIEKSTVPIVCIDCENFGYSNGQWLKCYEIYRNMFDYYIFIEDDYIPFTNNFDTLLIDNYKTRFDNNIGKLCGFAEGYPKHKKHIFPLHYDSIVCLSSQSLELLYTTPKWDRNPRKWLNKDIISTKIMINLKNQYLGAFNQINFSLLFTELDIPLQDYSDLYPVPYFAEQDNLMYYMISTKTSAHSSVSGKISSINDVPSHQPHICVPIQFMFLK
jgi:hypothetical protein